MSLSHSIQIDVPPYYALQKTWQMHFQQNQFTQSTFPVKQSNNVINRQVQLSNGSFVKQKVILDKNYFTISYQNIAGYAKGKMQLIFQNSKSNPDDLNKTKLTSITYARTNHGQFFPNKSQLQQGLNNSKTLLQARFRLEQQIPKCCQCKLFG